MEWTPFTTERGVVLCLRAATHPDLVFSGCLPDGLLKRLFDEESKLAETFPPEVLAAWRAARGGETVDRTPDFQRLAAKLIVGCLNSEGLFIPCSFGKGGDFAIEVLTAADLVGIHEFAAADINRRIEDAGDFFEHWSFQFLAAAAQWNHCRLSDLIFGDPVRTAIDVAAPQVVARDAKARKKTEGVE